MPWTGQRFARDPRRQALNSGLHKARGSDRMAERVLFRSIAADVEWRQHGMVAQAAQRQRTKRTKKVPREQ
eukprot:1365011-Rhodomonas_salina.1